MQITDGFDSIFDGKERILVVMAHPDDAELFAGGLISRLSRSGRAVRVVKVTTGDRGCRDMPSSLEVLSATRRSEDEASMAILGIAPEDSVYLGVRDGEVEPTLPLIERLAFQVRQFRPHLVVTTNPEDMVIRHFSGDRWINHRDHRNTAIATLDAVFPYSRDRLFFPDQLAVVEPHACTEFLLADYYGHAENTYFEVTDDVETRVRAMACHISQLNEKDARDSTDFFTMHEGSDRRFEVFRHVIAD
jgi:LmbE family N-acetylglucosaminyl deacetylase